MFNCINFISSIGNYFSSTGSRNSFERSKNTSCCCCWGVGRRLLNVLDLFRQDDRTLILLIMLKNSIVCPMETETFFLKVDPHSTCREKRVGAEMKNAQIPLLLKRKVIGSCIWLKTLIVLNFKSETELSLLCQGILKLYQVLFKDLKKGMI